MAEQTIAIAKTDNFTYQQENINTVLEKALILLGYDKLKYGTEKWNPLSELINSGDTVVLKPNLVMHVNGNSAAGTECLFTQVAVVKAILPYVIKGLQGHGRIVIGDAPMQSCDFEQLVMEGGYLNLLNDVRDELSNTNIDISLVDFREIYTTKIQGIKHYYDTMKKKSDSLAGKIVNLGTDSEFFGLSNESYRRLRVTDYDPDIMYEHHNLLVNEYKISKLMLDADVIINLPKPKTHRKGGVTIALKNMIGACSRKEYLPHHTIGTPASGGDEYEKTSFFRRWSDWWLDKSNHQMQAQEYLHASWGMKFVSRIFYGLSCNIGGVKHSEGSWWANETIARTIVDVNKILRYADKNGILCDKPQRRMFIVADMIVSGEGEGPLLPSPKQVGCLVAGEDLVCFDEAVSTLMGMRQECNHTLLHARHPRGKYSLTETASYAWLVSNDVRWHKKRLDDLSEEALFYFRPSAGWQKAFRKR